MPPRTAGSPRPPQRVPMTVAKKENLDKMRIILTRFKVQELEKYVFKTFSGINWEDAVINMHEKEESYTSKNFAKYFCRSVATRDNKDIFDLLEKFYLTDLCLHSHKKMWHILELSNGIGVDIMLTSNEMKDELTDNLANRGVKAYVTVLRFKSSYWVSVRPEKRARPLRRELKASEKYFVPTFFAIPVDSNVIYTNTTGSKMNKNIIRAVATTLGFGQAKYGAESGREFQQVKKKLDWKKNLRAKKFPVPDVPRTTKFVRIPRVNSKTGGVDFTSHQSRAKYMAALFGPDPPAFNFLTLPESKAVPLNRHNDDDPWDDVKIKYTITFQSDNAIELVQRLAVEGVIWDFPPPRSIRDSFLPDLSADEEEEEDF